VVRPTERERPGTGRNSRASVVGRANLQAAESVSGQVSRRVVAVAAGRISGDHRIVVQPALESRVNRDFRTANGAILSDSHGNGSTHLWANAFEELDQRFSQRFGTLAHKITVING